MSKQYLALSSDIYNALLTAARKSGLSPENWIASHLILHLNSPSITPLSQKLERLIGAINSQEQPIHSRRNTPFGEAVAAKLEKQGLRRP
jgi:hypothetical protein